MALCLADEPQFFTFPGVSDRVQIGRNDWGNWKYFIHFFLIFPQNFFFCQTHQTTQFSGRLKQVEREWKVNPTLTQIPSLLSNLIQKETVNKLTLAHAERVTSLIAIIAFLSFFLCKKAARWTPSLNLVPF